MSVSDMSFGIANKAPVEQKEARAKVVNTATYANSYHSEWLRKGVGSGR
jgi:hypothetical protein